MDPKATWTSSEGISALKSIAAARIPHWTNGLRPFQLDCVPRILDGQRLLCCTATSDGKSALFSLPILAHFEIFAHRSQYPKLDVKECPVGIVVTPTKGLAGNIVRLATSP